MYKLLKILFGLLILLVLIIACNPKASPTIEVNNNINTQAAEESQNPTSTTVLSTKPSDNQEGVIITDALGHSVNLQKIPQRIVLAGRGATLITDAVYLFPAAIERVISSPSKGGQDIYGFISTIDDNLSSKAMLETDAGPEEIAALNPDVVILKSYNAEQLGDPLEKLGIPVIYLDLETPEQYWRDLNILGKLFQDETRAEEIISYYQNKSSEIENKNADLMDDGKPRVLIIYYSNRDGNIAFNVPPLSWIQTMLVNMSGGIPVWDDIELGNGWTKVNYEQIATWDSDEVFIVDYFNNVDETVSNLKNDPQWKLLRATKEEQLYAFPKDYISWDQADPRWIIGLTWLANKINQNIYNDLKINDETKSFFLKMFNINNEKFSQQIEPKLQGDLD